MTKQGSPYHHNGKYSPDKASSEVQRKYAAGTTEYRESIEEIGCGIWAAIILICVIVFVLIDYFKGVVQQ